MAGMLTWQSDERCVVGEIAFQIPPVGILDSEQPSIPMAGADFLLLKPRTLVERSDLVSEITVANGLVEVRRGDAQVDSRGFDIFDCLDASGRSLLARDER